MATYTFITDFQDGTYISQHPGENLQEACMQWRDYILSRGPIQLLDGKAFSKAFEADFEELPPVALDGLTQVWVFQLLVGEDLLNVHIIQTVVAVEEAPDHFPLVKRLSRTSG